MILRTMLLAANVALLTCACSSSESLAQVPSNESVGVADAAQDRVVADVTLDAVQDSPTEGSMDSSSDALSERNGDADDLDAGRDSASLDAPTVDATSDAPQGYVGRNGSTLLKGASFPNGSQSLASLRKKVPFKQNSDPSGLVALDVFIARADNAEDDAFYVMVPVRNDGGRPYCFALAEEVKYFDADNKLIAGRSFWDLSGSVGKSGSVYTSTCLGTGEIGYFADLQVLKSYSAVARVELTLGADKDLDISDPVTIPRATGYTFEAPSTLRVDVHSDGPGGVTIQELFNFYVLLDDAGEPLWFKTLHTSTGKDVSLDSGATVQLVDPSVHYGGTGSQILVFLGWADK